MSVVIRNAADTDVPYLYEICLKTGFYGKDASALFSDPLMAGQFCAAPYLFYQKEFCFIADNNRIPAGYVIGTSETIPFYHWMENEWLPLLRLRYPENYPDKSECERQIIEAIHTSAIPPSSLWMEEYPAHIHINLLPELQGHGWGRKLIDTAAERFLRAGIGGMHLGIWKKNTGADAFYRKLGFCVLSESAQGRIFGMKL